MEDSIKEKYSGGDYEIRIGYQSKLEEIAPAIEDEDRLPGSNISPGSEMDERLEEIMESYSGSDESVSMSVYLEPEREYIQKPEAALAQEDEGGAEAVGAQARPDHVCLECGAELVGTDKCSGCGTLLVSVAGAAAE